MGSCRHRSKFPVNSATDSVVLYHTRKLTISLGINSQCLFSTTDAHKPPLDKECIRSLPKCARPQTGSDTLDNICGCCLCDKTKSDPVSGVRDTHSTRKGTSHTTKFMCVCDVVNLAFNNSKRKSPNGNDRIRNGLFGKFRIAWSNPHAPTSLGNVRKRFFPLKVLIINILRK